MPAYPEACPSGRPYGKDGNCFGGRCGERREEFSLEKEQRSQRTERRINQKTAAPHELGACRKLVLGAQSKERLVISRH